MCVDVDFHEILCLGFGRFACLVFGVWRLGFGVWGLGFGVWGLVASLVWRLGLKRADIRYLISSIQNQVSNTPIVLLMQHQTPNAKRSYYPLFTGGAITDPHLLQVRLCSSE